MKVKIFLLTLLPLLWAFSCEDEEVTLSASYEEEYSFEVNSDQNTGQEGWTIKASSIKGSAEDIANIDRIDIQSIAVKIDSIYSDNQTNTVTLKAIIDNEEIFSDFEVEIPKSKEYKSITTKEDGVNLLKNKLKGYLDGTYSSDTEIQVSYEANNNSGEKIHVDVSLKIEAGIVGSVN